MSTVYKQNDIIKQDDIIPVMIELLTDWFDKYKFDDKSNPAITRLKFNILPTPLLDWLNRQKERRIIYWSDRDKSFETAGIGYADIKDDKNTNSQSLLFESISSLITESENDIKYFGGFRFDAKQETSEKWQTFGNYCFILPRFEIIQKEGKYQFICNLIPERDLKNKNVIINEIQNLIFADSSFETVLPQVVAREDFPDKERWTKNINSALKVFATGKYEKIVIARKTEFTFKANINPIVILSRLKDNTDNCFHFLFQTHNGNCFIGATPERLYYRKEKELYCEALAGTRPRGNNAEDDTKYADKLFNSEKELREQKLVTESIVEAIRSLVVTDIENMDMSPTLLKLDQVQHLKTRFKVELKSTISDNDLISAIHPTAAVGGYPKNKIMDDIYIFEQFDRGWYAAPVGWIGQQSSEFAVAIRCGLISRNKLTLYSGAGILKGSEPEKEWKEIDHKIRNFLKILENK